MNKVYNSTYTDIIKNIRQTILEKVGIPVSIGLSCSKTLAKLASDKAKSNNGIFVIRPDKIITLKNLTYGKQIQQSLFETLTPNDDKLSHLVDELEAKYGQGIIKSGM